jgi:hypothetical protein
MKHILGAVAVAAALTFAGGATSMPAFAQTVDTTSAANALETNHATSATDMSARRRHWRGYRVVRPFPQVYPYSYGSPYGYYRPRPVIYPYGYSYYRPRPIFYRPYYAPAPFFSVGFGPRYW